MRISYTLLSPAVLPAVRAATVFILQDEFVGTDFLHGWNWETFNDPTRGRTNYVDQNTALERNLSFGKAPRFY
jgi:hypothetical protein